MAINSNGTVFYFTPAGGDKVAVGRLSAIGELTPDSEEIDVTTLDSEGGCREYVQGYRDSGELAIEGFHASADAGQAAMRAAYAAGGAGTAEIVFPDGSGATFSAYVKSYTLGAAKVDGAVGFGAKLRITGPVSCTGM